MWNLVPSYLPFYLSLPRAHPELTQSLPSDHPANYGYGMCEVWVRNNESLGYKGEWRKEKGERNSFLSLNQDLQDLRIYRIRGKI